VIIHCRTEVRRNSLRRFIKNLTFVISKHEKTSLGSISHKTGHFTMTARKSPFFFCQHKNSRFWCYSMRE
jgi:hypothetical protein